MAGELFKPHDHLFRTVFREESEAAGLLRAYLPEAVAGELRWSSLKRQDVSFIDDLLRASEADLLYAVERRVDDAPAWMLRAVRAPVDAGRAGGSARRGAGADRADGADGGVSGELAGAGDRRRRRPSHLNPN